MELRRALTVSLLLFLIVKVGVAGDLVCHCTGSADPRCHFDGEVHCPEPYMCAVMYDKYPHSHVPNPQAMCSNQLEPGACNGSLNNATQFIACCEDRMCNDHDLVSPVYADPSTTEPTALTTVMSNRTPRTTDAITVGGPSTGNMRLYFGISIGLPLLLVVAVLSLLLLTYLYYCHLKKKVRLDSLPKKWDLAPSPSVNFDFKLTIPTTDVGTNSCSLGSGSGLPLLTQRTVARSIKLGERIGSGRFGQVFVGDYQGDKVAVKKFVSHDDKSWARETEIYNTVYLINESILGFFASDMVSNNGATELWLITHYHPNGSLHDYLSREVISKDTVIRMVSSCCSGLSHLHTELPGTTGKPAIAHRDIKSRNILVKQNLECCIADFGLAVMKDTNGLSLPTNPRQGTKRYMAPEILDESINMERFESFKQADVYSLGLVMWEICRRCVLKDGVTLDYQLPFQGLVPADPSFEDMKRLVVVERMQPPIHDEWLEDALLQVLAKTMQECWHYEALARPTAANRKKRIARLLLEQSGNSVPVKLVTCDTNT